jgi:hypothetical protein
VPSKEEFAKIVREMQAAGTPLTVRNLMLKTELPRATVEEWLEDLQSGAKLVPKAEPKVKPDDDKPGAKTKVKERDADGEPGVFARASALKDQVVGEVVKSQLGFDNKSKDVEKKSLALSAILGLVFPPAMFAYAAPVIEAVIGSILYLVLALGVQKIPLVGGLLGIYVVLALNLLGALLGLGYAFRYNRNGKRMTLLPKSTDEA